MRPKLLAGGLVLVLVLAACGGGGSSDADEDDVPGGADPEAARVIDEWSTALRKGDVQGAADYFRVPSVAQNGTPRLNLDSRRDVVAFNEALPCGAELISAESHSGYVLATFELTERPGEGTCGDGVGNRASTAFKIEDGKIVEWIRAADDLLPEEESVEGPVV